MSYKNASVPLEPGLNLIVGPNGAGKSSILLGISVVLGQAYTERARKLRPIEKVLMLEDAVGVGVYRKEVLEASDKLQKLTTERETMSSVLQGTKETYQHWQREYEKYETKKKLEQQLKDLQRELSWRRILRKEASQKRIQDRIA